MRASDNQIIVIEQGRSKVISRSTLSFQSLIVNDLSDTIYFPHAKVVSRKHARIEWWDDQILVEDLDSTHGTYIAHKDAQLGVDGFWEVRNPYAELVRVTEVTRLRVGDYVQFGKECESGLTEYHPVRLYVSIRKRRALTYNSLIVTNRCPADQVCSCDESRRSVGTSDAAKPAALYLYEVDSMTDSDAECKAVARIEAPALRVSETEDDLTSGTSLFQSKVDISDSTKEQVESTKTQSSAKTSLDDDTDFAATSCFGDSAESSPNDELRSAETTLVDESVQCDTEEVGKLAASTCDSTSTGLLKQMQRSCFGPASLELPAEITEEAEHRVDTVATMLETSAVGEVSIPLSPAMKPSKRCAEETSELGRPESSLLSASKSASAPLLSGKRRRLAMRRRQRRQPERDSSSRKTVGKVLRGFVYTASLFSIGFLSGSVFTFKAVMNTAAQIPSAGTAV